MPLLFQKLSRNQYLEKLKEYEDYFASLNFFTETIKKKFSELDCIIPLSDLEIAFQKAIHKKEMFVKQQNCLHKQVDMCSGNYHICLHCNAMLNIS
jgi:hypothetical protein